MSKPTRTTKPDKEKRDDQIGVRITAEEREKLDALFIRLKKKYAFLTQTIMWRELMSLSDSNIITQEMRDELSGKALIRDDWVTPIEDGENGEELKQDNKKQA